MKKALRKLKTLLFLTLFFMVLVPAGAVIMHNNRAKFVDTMCLVAGPYVIITIYSLIHRKK